MSIIYRVHMMESERGWGQDYWTEDFATREEAELRMKTVNDRNTEARAPDYYIQANKIEVVEVKKYETVAMHGSMTEIEEARGEYKRAVANPQTIIALIDRAEKAEQDARGKELARYATAKLVKKERARAEKAERELAEAKALIDEQANDEGLWFHAITAPEVYLQSALRRLHAAVEGKTETQCALEALRSPSPGQNT